jgi:hypothetical protein
VPTVATTVATTARTTAGTTAADAPAFPRAVMRTAGGGPLPAGSRRSLIGVLGHHSRLWVARTGSQMTSPMMAIASGT